MIFRNYLGLDLQPQAMRAVSLRRQGKGFSLTGGRLLGMEEGILVPSFRSPNIRNEERFIDNVREVLGPLAGKEDRISLSLPDQSGLVLLTESESTLASKSEGIDVLKWQLRDKLPADVDLQLDYQVLARDDAGRQKTLVVCIALDVLKQYEDVISRAGYGAEMIGFRSLNLFNFYQGRFDSGDNFALVQVEDTGLCFQFYQGGKLVFYRSRDVGRELESVYREISRTLSGEGERLSALKRSSVYVHTNWDDRDALRQAFAGLFSSEPEMLNPAVEKLTSGTLVLSEKQSYSIVTAIGAAERLM